MLICRTLAVLGLYGYFPNVLFKIFQTVPVDRFIAVDTSEIEELSCSSTRFLIVSMFSPIILVCGGPGNVEGEMSPEAINLLITLEEADVVTI